jgi:hypothetical protein
MGGSETIFMGRVWKKLTPTPWMAWRASVDVVSADGVEIT